MIILNACQRYVCLAFLLLSAPVYGQSNAPRYSIKIKTTPSGISTDYRIDVTRNGNVIQLRYGRLDSVRLTQMNADPAVLALQALVNTGKLHTLSEAERISLFQQVMAANERNSVYKWDSLQITPASHRSLVQLFDSVSTSSAEQLERKGANRNRIVLDGIFFSITVQSEQTVSRKLYVHSPDRTSHPQLSRLIRESLDLYRKERPNASLDKKYTWGY